MAESAASARRALKAAPVDLVVLGIIMPGEDGLALCRYLRDHAQRARRYRRPDTGLEPTQKMEEAARKAKTLSYRQPADMPPKEYDRVQILTAYETIEGAKIDCPPTMRVVKRFRESRMEMKV